MFEVTEILNAFNIAYNYLPTIHVYISNGGNLRIGEDSVAAPRQSVVPTRASSKQSFFIVCCIRLLSIMWLLSLCKVTMFPRTLQALQRLFSSCPVQSIANFRKGREYGD